MVLAIDIGNSNIVFGGYKGNEVIFSSRVRTDSSKTQWEYAALIKGVLSLNGCEPSDFKAAALSSVVPPITAVLEEATEILGIKNTLTVGPGIKTGLNIKIDNPSELGADLVCTAVAAIEKYERPIIVVDLGTATKFSIINRNKCFLGGAIMPGVEVALSALSASAAQLPHIALNKEIKVIGTNTIDCMLSGSILGAASMIDGMIQRYFEAIGEEAVVIACGGLAKAIIPHCKSKIVTDDNLVLDGLMAIYNKNNL